MSPLEILCAEREIRQVLMRYAQAVDRKDWESLRTCYHDDAIDNHGPFAGSADDFVAWVKQRHETVTSSIHVLGNIDIAFDPDGRRARTETYCVAYSTTDGSGDSTYAGGMSGPVRSTIVARYVDDFEHRDDHGWRIRERRVVYEWIDASQVASLELDPAWIHGRRGRDDALCWPLTPLDSSTT